MKKLSVITISLNDREGLEKTIRSLIAQTFRDFEFIVIDGGSEDGTKELLEKNTASITHWVSEKDGGIYHAQNKGIVLAGGEYCLFLNSGDYLAAPEVLERVFRNPSKADILYGNMIIEYADGKKRLGKMPAELSFHHMIADTLWHPVSFIRRDLFAKYGNYDESLKMVSDYDFFFKTIIAHEVTRLHLDITVAVFNMKGFSSDPKHAELRAKERRVVQLRYVPLSAIKSAESYNRLLHSRWYKLSAMFKLV